MRASCVVALLGLLASSASIACSCYGTGTIGAALTESEAVVLGRVEKVIPADYTRTAEVPEGVVFDVLKTVKGDVSGKVYVPTFAYCYQSFSPSEFKVGEEYVLPLFPVPAPIDHGPTTVVITTPSTATEPAGRWFELAECSHSALALVDGDLYTNELGKSGGRQRRHYMSLTSMEILLPLGLLDARRVYLYLAVAVLVVVGILVRRRFRRNSDGV